MAAASRGFEIGLKMGKGLRPSPPKSVMKQRRQGVQATLANDV
jgi:hypothetical protein